MYSGDRVVEVDHELLSVDTELTVYAFFILLIINGSGGTFS